MTDYTELVKALRCGEYKPECGSSNCPYWSGLGCMDGQLMEDAADAIEAVQAEVDEAKQHNTDLLNMKEMTKEEEDEILEYIRTTSVGPLEPILIEQLPKRGEWINHKDEHQCSVCRETVVVDEIRWEQIGAYDFCPNCGAKMDGKENGDADN